jgi:integrase
VSKHLWSVTRIKHPKFPRLTVRVGEFTPGGMVHVFWWTTGKQRSRSLGYRRLDLGPSKAAQEREARRLACDFIERLATAPSAATDRSTPLTLGRLRDRYTGDGLLRVSPGYRRDTLASMRRVVDALGDETLVTDIRPSHLERHLAHRIRDGHAVAGCRDLVALGKACRWAEGEELIDTNPLRKDKAREAMRVRTKIERPYVTLADYHALRSVANKVRSPAFPVLLDLAWHTGRRVGALLNLRWEDVRLGRTPDSEEGTVTWYAGVTPDKKKHEQTAYLNREAHAALFAWRRHCAAAAGYVFPMRDDPTKPMGRTGPKKWLMQAERAAGLNHQKQGGWHMFRRGWATARKSLPLQDVMKAGGWTDEATLMRCYQQATPAETKRAALYIVA